MSKSLAQYGLFFAHSNWLWKNAQIESVEHCRYRIWLVEIENEIRGNALVQLRRDAYHQTKEKRTMRNIFSSSRESCCDWFLYVTCATEAIPKTAPIASNFDSFHETRKCTSSQVALRFIPIRRATINRNGQLIEKICFLCVAHNSFPKHTQNTNEMYIFIFTWKWICLRVWRLNGSHFTSMEFGFSFRLFHWQTWKQGLRRCRFENNYECMSFLLYFCKLLRIKLITSTNI